MSHDPTVVLGPLVKQDHVDLQSNVQSNYLLLHTSTYYYFFLVFCHCHFVLCYLLLPKLPTNVLSVNTDYGRPMKPFFHLNQELFGLGRQIGQITSGAFGVFSADLSAPMLIL